MYTLRVLFPWLELLVAATSCHSSVLRNHLRNGQGIVALLAERNCACGVAGSLSHLTRASWLTEIELSF